MAGFREVVGALGSAGICTTSDSSVGLAVWFYRLGRLAAIKRAMGVRYLL